MFHFRHKDLGGGTVPCHMQARILQSETGYQQVLNKHQLIVTFTVKMTNIERRESVRERRQGERKAEVRGIRLGG